MVSVVGFYVMEGISRLFTIFVYRRLFSIEMTQIARPFCKVGLSSCLALVFFSFQKFVYDVFCCCNVWEWHFADVKVHGEHNQEPRIRFVHCLLVKHGITIGNRRIAKHTPELKCLPLHRFLLVNSATQYVLFQHYNMSWLGFTRCPSTPLGILPI